MTKKILCAVDGSDHSRRAIAVASELAKAVGGELNLLVVDQVSFDGRSAPVHRLNHSGVTEILEAARTVAAAAGYPEPKLTALASRDVARGILNFAEEHNVDHIVVGTGEKGTATRLVVGSVSHDLVGRAHCSVPVAH